MMCPIGVAHAWRLPPILNAGELADWLGVTTGELDWFADLRTLEFKRSQGRLRHYHYRPLTKRFGQVRLIEAPKSRLKEIQRRILKAIFAQIPPHDAAHGFCAGRSIKTFATPHVGKKVVLKIDLQDFFPSISAARIQSVFRAVGYPESVADLLAGLCTNATPEDVWQGEQAESRLLVQEARWRYSLSSSATRRTNITGIGKPVRVSNGLPAVWSRTLCRCGLHTVCRRSCVFR